jgi:hypothetical protein
MEREPELLLTGHTGAIAVTRPMLDDFLAWARQLEGAFTRLCAVPERVNEALDPDFVVCFPYLSSIRAGATLELEVRVTEHGPRPEVAEVSLALPLGWRAVPAAATADVAPGGEAALLFSVRVPAGEPPGRRVLIADLTLGGRRYGQRAEAIVDVVPAAAARTATSATIGGRTRGL